MLRGNILLLLIGALFCAAIQANPCRDYLDANGTYHPPQACAANSNGSYCCGSCEDRYCCRNSIIAVDQDACPTPLPPGSCSEYVNSFGTYRPAQQCSVGQSCCGSCLNRYCCSAQSDYLSQTNCSSPMGETCNAYTDGSYYYTPSQACPRGQYCCGSCQSRYCCPTSSSRLSQASCPPATGETCSSYTDSTGYYYSSQQCSVGQYCCGTCPNRFCCSSFTDRLSQPSCSAGETCNAYTDSNGYYSSSQQCSSGQFCCGTCRNRYCCTSASSRLSQSSCSSVTTGETCNAYSDYSGSYSPPQQCSSGQYCCGSCTYRYCCSSISSRLSQTSCSSSSGQSCSSYSAYGVYFPSQSCPGTQFCCGACSSRYCCSSASFRLNQSDCALATVSVGGIVGIVAGVFVFIVAVSIVSCFLCACCCFQGRRRTNVVMMPNVAYLPGRVVCSQAVVYPPSQPYGDAPPPYPYSK